MKKACVTHSIHPSSFPPPLPFLPLLSSAHIKTRSFALAQNKGFSANFEYISGTFDFGKGQEGGGRDWRANGIISRKRQEKPAIPLTSFPFPLPPSSPQARTVRARKSP